MKKLYRNDLILNLIIIIVCIAVPIAISVSSHNEEKTAVISFDGNTEKETSLSENGVFYTHGVEVTVKDGKAFVSESNCPDGLCMKMKGARNVGDSIICVPNKVSVRVVGEKTGEGADVVAG